MGKLCLFLVAKIVIYTFFKLKTMLCWLYGKLVILAGVRYVAPGPDGSVVGQSPL